MDTSSRFLTFMLSVVFLFIPTNGTSSIETSCTDDPYIDCKLADETYNICTQRTLAAVKICTKYCGYCTVNGSTLPPQTGTPVETCIDSGDVDCKKMNDTLHICAKKTSPPTILFCPKFCGLCMPSGGGNVAHHVFTTASGELSGNGSCKDEIYMDCKEADDKHNICSERTLAAVKYCQHYCGFCSVNGSTIPPPTGTTLETCIDSGDIDCKKMNDTLHICAMKNTPPTLLFCPKFCGLCTPSGGGNVAHTTHAANYSISRITISHPLTHTSTATKTMITTSLKPATPTNIPHKTQPPSAITCVVCSGPQFLCDQLYAPTSCTPPNNYCINSITNKIDGTMSVDRACGNYETCYREWFQGSSDDDKCRNFDSNDQQFLDFKCTFCCITDNCNIPLHPKNNTLYRPI